MSRKKIILITGSNGEIGKNLIDYFSKSKSSAIVSLDLQPNLDESKVHKHVVGSILDDTILPQSLINHIVNSYSSFL